MDNNFDESEFDESNAEINSSPTLGGFNGFSGGFSSAIKNDDREKDIKSINDRTGKNEEIRNTDEDYGRTSSREKKQKQKDENSDSITGSDRGKGSDELESTKSKKEKEESTDSKKSSEEKKEDKSDNKKKEDKKKEDNIKKDSEEGGFLKSKLAKIKIYLIIAGVVLGVFGLVFIGLVIITAIDNLTLGLTNFYGVPETKNEKNGDVPGLYSDDVYHFDDEGNPMGREELIKYLEENSNCDGNFWTSISDGWNALWGLKIKDACELIRYIRKETKKYKVDESLIISSLFYGYDTRPKADMYINPESAPDMVDTVEHYATLTELLQDKNITIKRKQIDDLIKNAHAIHKRFWYEWKIDISTNDEGEVTHVNGRCEYKEVSEDKYTLDRWKIFMRWGQEVSDAFVKLILTVRDLGASDDECKPGGYTDSQLLEEVKSIAKSYGPGVGYSVSYGTVNDAREKLKEPVPDPRDYFYQVADISSKTKDVFKNYNGLVFDYKNGFAYQKYPSFKPSMESGGTYYGKVNIKYDDIFTVKEDEQLIQNIVGKKMNMNNALLREDPDDDNSVNYMASLGGYSGVPTGANCMPYLTASLNDIKVNLTDCYGKELGTVSFEDYIIGVANGEVSNRNDDYVLSEMVAAISYALNRHSNYKKGNTITMRSGTCDQVYCSMLKGCTRKHTPVGSCEICNSYYIGGGNKNPSLYSKYQALYEIASDYLIVKGDAPFSAHYVSTSQNRWYDKASKGMSFTQIMQEEYADEGATLIRCTDPSSEVSNEDLPDTEKEKHGNKSTGTYPNVAKDLGPFYGFSYKDEGDGVHITINPEWKDANLVTISPTCEGNSAYSNMKFTVNKGAVKNFEKAFKKVCKILTNGLTLANGKKCNYTIDDIMDGTVFIERKTTSGTFDLHAYGLAQDINYSKKIEVDGKIYTPYNTRDLSEYLDFVNAIGGKEENCKNINYVLWAYAYKEAGFQWGGNYGRNGNSGSFDGKLFELKYN